MSVSIEERNSLIYKLWNDNGGSFEVLSTLKFPGCLSLKTVRNIVYSGGQQSDDPDDDCSYTEEVYRLFKYKFLQFQDVNRAIHWVWENQPKRKLSVSALRRIVRDMAKADRRTKNLYKNI